MKDITDKELFDRFVATQKALVRLRTGSSYRRHVWEHDLHALGDPFVRDASVLKSSKSWRRMGGKNQVASASFLPHIRNRMTHVGEVVACGIRIADHLGLNAHLTHAIAEGHDIGHVPFGHQGEHYLQTKIGKGFCHERMGVILAQHIERLGNGLNLTHAVLDGMFRHSGKNAVDTMTPEAWVVRYADKIAYIFADYNDFWRMNWKCAPELNDLMSWFGHNQRSRCMRTIMALCEESADAGKVVFEKSEAAIAFNNLRTLMYHEYERVVEQDVSSKLDPIYIILERSDQVPAWLGLSLLTDEEVYRINSEQRIIDWRTLMNTGMGEIVMRMERERLFAINPMNLDLSW